MVTAAVGLFLAAALVFFQSEWGRGVLARGMESLLSSGSERRVVINGLHGFVPFEAKLKRLEIGDSGGVWLTGEDLLLRWSPLALLAGRVHMNEVSVSTVRVNRSPDAKTDRGDGSFGFPLLPSWMQRVIVERGEIAAPRLSPG